MKLVKEKSVNIGHEVPDVKEYVRLDMKKSLIGSCLNAFGEVTEGDFAVKKILLVKIDVSFKKWHCHQKVWHCYRK